MYQEYTIKMVLLMQYRFKFVVFTCYGAVSPNVFWLPYHARSRCNIRTELATATLRLGFGVSVLNLLY